MRRLPSYFVTGFTVLISTLFYFSSVDPALIYLDRMAVWQGDMLRLLSGHLMHTDLQHWALNTGVFAILGAIIEQRSRGLLLVGLVAGMCAVDLWLVSPWASIQVYCGLSGVLNTLFVLAAGVVWERNPHGLIPALLIGAGIKIVVELVSGVAVLSATLWPPYPPAHLAGFLGGLIIAGFYIVATESHRPTPASRSSASFP